MTSELGPGTCEVAGGLADHAGSLGTDGETCLARSLTAGIAHEIKNPLNFVNNFSAVSVELIDELREALGGVHLDKNLRAEINEIADKSNTKCLQTFCCSCCEIM